MDGTDALGLLILAAVIAVGLRGVAYSRRVDRIMGDAESKLAGRVDAPGIDEKYAKEVAVGGGTVTGPDEGGMR